MVAQCARPCPHAYYAEVGGEPARGWPGTPTRLGTMVIGVRPGPQATSIPCHPQAAGLCAQAGCSGLGCGAPSGGQAQGISRSRFSSSLSSGQPWHPRWPPRHQRRIRRGMRSHQAVRPEPLPVHLGSSCPFPAPPWWQLSGRRKTDTDGVRNRRVQVQLSLDETWKPAPTFQAWVPPLTQFCVSDPHVAL